MGTIRLAVGVLSGLAGLLYSIVFFVPLFTGEIEVSPTEVSVDLLESEETPDACWLKVTDGYVVFSEAEATVHGNRSDGSGKIGFLSVPVMSKSLWETWKAGVEDDKPIDLSTLRLVLVLGGDQVQQLWPEVERQIISEKKIKPTVEQVTLIGETIPKGSFYPKPFSDNRPQSAENLNWDEIVFLRFEKDHCSLASRLKDLAIGIGLVLLSVAVITYDRRHPTRPPKPTLNVEVLESLVDADG
jgi:hypothetical protein